MYQLDTIAISIGFKFKIKLANTFPSIIYNYTTDKDATKSCNNCEILAQIDLQMQLRNELCDTSI